MDALELEIQVVVSYHVQSGNQTGVFWKSNQCVLLTADLFPRLWRKPYSILLLGLELTSVLLLRPSKR